jgi:hypothetical protein
MIRRSFAIASAVSLLLCVATMAMWVRSRTRGDSFQYTTSPYKPVQHRFGYDSYDGRLSLCFNSFYEPNLLIRKMVNDHDVLTEDWGMVVNSETITIHSNWSFWNSSDSSGESGALGFYGSWSHERSKALRNILIPYCFLWLATAVMPVLWGWRLWLRAKMSKRRSRGQCLACGYDLRETKEKCPECGTASTPPKDEACKTRFCRLTLLTVPLILVAVSSGVGIFWHLDSRQRPELQVELTPEQIASALKPGMNVFESSDILREPRSDSQFDITLTSSSSKSNYLKCIPFSDGATLICEYPNVGPTNMVSCKLLRFDDLRSSVPNDLFSAVRLIHLTSSAVGERFDPTPLIRAVNALHSLGKTTALRALRAYVDIAAPDWKRSWRYNMDDRRALLVAQLLFERPENEQNMAVVNAGHSYPEAGPNRNDWPLFPLCVENDIPFCMVEGYFQPVDTHSIDEFLDRCETVGAIRKAPLNPTSTPLQAVEALASSERWRRRYADKESSEKELGLLRVQGMRASAPLLTVLRNEDWSYLAVVSREVGDRICDHFLHDRRLEKMWWDTRIQRFAIRDE